MNSLRFKRSKALKGFTLVEILVVVLIASIIFLMVGTVLASTFTLIKTGETRTQLNENARQAINRITKLVQSSTLLPPMDDRNMDGLPDQLPTGAPYNQFGLDAEYNTISGFNDGVPFITAGFLMSGCFSDQMWLQIDKDVILGSPQNLNQGYSIGNISSTAGTILPESLPGYPGYRVAGMRTLIRAAIPFDNTTPYYLASVNVGRQSNMDYGFGNHPLFPKETVIAGRTVSNVLIEDQFYRLRQYEDTTGSTNPGVNQSARGSLSLSGSDAYSHEAAIPIAGNITGLRFEYLHEVPLYAAEPNGDPIMIDTNDNGTPDSYVKVGSKLMPIDVCDNTKIIYDMNNTVGSEFRNWAMDDWLIINSTVRPLDFKGYVQLPDGSIQFKDLRFDVEDLTGVNNDDGFRADGTDGGNGDGIPDGDGIADDPVPLWWVPYIKAIRVTVVASPQTIIKERRDATGKTTFDGSNGVVYRLDSPVPYTTNRNLANPPVGSLPPVLQPLIFPVTNRKDLYIGEGKDVILSSTIYPTNLPRENPVINPIDYRLSPLASITGTVTGIPQGRIDRRVDYNWLRGRYLAYFRSISPDDRTGPVDRSSEYIHRGGKLP